MYNSKKKNMMMARQYLCTGVLEFICRTYSSTVKLEDLSFIQFSGHKDNFFADLMGFSSEFLNCIPCRYTL